MRVNLQPCISVPFRSSMASSASRSSSKVKKAKLSRFFSHLFNGPNLLNASSKSRLETRSLSLDINVVMEDEGGFMNHEFSREKCILDMFNIHD